MIREWLGDDFFVVETEVRYAQRTRSPLSYTLNGLSPKKLNRASVRTKYNKQSQGRREEGGKNKAAFMYNLIYFLSFYDIEVKTDAQMTPTS